MSSRNYKFSRLIWMQQSPSFHRVIIDQFLLQISINLLAFYHKYHSLIGYTTHCKIASSIAVCRCLHQRLLWAAHGWMFPCASVSKRDFIRNLKYENEFDYHDIGNHMNGFAFRLVLTEAKCNSEMAYWMSVEKHSWVKKRRVKYRKIKIFWSNVMQRFRCLNMVRYWHPLGGWIRSLVKSF